MGDETTLTIPEWANGPGAPGSGTGNGGWSAGLLAARLPRLRGGAAGVDLRVPPPIGRALRVELDGGLALLWDDDAAVEPILVARAADALVSLDVPDAARALTPQTARTASSAFPFAHHHPFPQCVACGTDRPADLVALDLHCGPVDGAWTTDAVGERAAIFADAWQPGPDLADAVQPDQVTAAACWSALDCPSAAPFADPSAEHASVLARIAVRLDAPVLVGESYVVAAWRIAVDGRKRRSASAIVDDAGRVLGVAEALWIEVQTR